MCDFASYSYRPLAPSFILIFLQGKNPGGPIRTRIRKIHPHPVKCQVACWKGKSRLNAWKNQLVDQRTNSIQEGFRLEGIETPPKSLEERIHAVMEAKGMAATSKYVSPKVRMKLVHWGPEVSQKNNMSQCHEN